MLKGASFDYKKVLKRLAEHVLRYRIVLTSVLICGIFAFAVVRIDMLSNPTVDEARLNEQITTLKRVNFDNDAIDKIQQLVDSGIEIDSNFDPDRDNPFVDQ